jgi:outer membrane protein assembly factor BamE
MKMTLYRVSAGAIVALATALLPACKSVEVPKVPGITPYRMVIQQGNFISQEMVSQLKPGMTKEQVRFVLGTPLVTDIFHADRWDYVFFREMPNGKREQRNLSVVFEDSKLARVVGDLLPSDGTVQSGGFAPQVKPEANPKPEAKPEKPAEPKAETKPVADAAKPAAEPDKPAQSVQNWGTKDWSAKEPEKKVETAPPSNPPASTAAEEKKAPGFFDRLREKMGL